MNKLFETTSRAESRRNQLRLAHILPQLGCIAMLAVPMIALAGCQKSAIQQTVPYPVSLLLPKDIRIHSFTSTKAFDDAGKQKGIEVHIEARDAYGDTTKAFGDFRFELYVYRPQSPDPKGRLIATWSEPLQDPKVNALHWGNVARTYIFKLQSEQPLKAGSQYVLVAVFSSPYTERLFDQRVFTAGK